MPVPTGHLPQLALFVPALVRPFALVYWRSLRLDVALYLFFAGLGACFCSLLLFTVWLVQQVRPALALA